MSTHDNIPFADSASSISHTTTCLGIAIDDEMVMVFPRGHVYAKAKRIAERLGGVIYEVDTEVTYTVLPTNRPYDTTPLIERRT